MTILPKRNKRRLEQRDQESSQQQGASGSLLEVQTSHRSSHTHPAGPGSLQVDLNHPHSHLGGRTGLHPQHANAYNTMIYSHVKNDKNSYNTLGMRTHGHPALSVDTKWRRSPPTRTLGASDEKYAHPHKKSKRSKTKQKHNPYDYPQLQDNHSPHSHSHSKSLSVSGKLLSMNTTQQSRQILIPPGSSANISLVQLSPKMPGGAQQKSGSGQRSTSPESEAAGGGEYPSASSPGGCNSEDEHVPTQQEDHTEEVRHHVFAIAQLTEVIQKQYFNFAVCNFQRIFS